MPNIGHYIKLNCIPIYQQKSIRKLNFTKLEKISRTVTQNIKNLDSGILQSLCTACKSSLLNFQELCKSTVKDIVKIYKHTIKYLAASLHFAIICDFEFIYIYYFCLVEYYTIVCYFIFLSSSTFTLILGRTKSSFRFFHNLAPVELRCL